MDDAIQKQPSVLRSLLSPLWLRRQFAAQAGVTFGGARDTYEALGYQRVLRAKDYRARWQRGGVASRIVEAMPESTWRGDWTVIENDDPKDDTPFEKAFKEFDKRLKLRQMFLRADKLAGIGRYSIILIGAPGEMNTPLVRASADNIKYLQCYSEEDAQITGYEAESGDERWGYPTEYSLTRAATISAPGSSNRPVTPAKPVHWSRVLHIADGLLDDPIFGRPRLEPVWNLLDDLDKVIGGGAEAYWKRADGGTQYKISPDFVEDPDPEVAAKKRKEMEEKFDEFTNQLRKNIFTRGVDINRLGSDVADLRGPAAAIMDQISATIGMPQRILMGSELGKLASSKDKTNWDDRVQDRRNSWADPYVVRLAIDRFIQLGALPTPKQYRPEWPTQDEMDEGQKVAAADRVASVNERSPEIIVTPSEIRTVYLGLQPMTEEQKAEVAKIKEDAVAAAPPTPGPGGPQPASLTDETARLTAAMDLLSEIDLDELDQALVSDNLDLVEDALVHVLSRERAPSRATKEVAR